MRSRDIDSEFNACMFREHCRRMRRQIEELVWDRDRYKDALSKIVWIKDCGIDSVVPSSSLADYARLINHPADEREAMYATAKAALGGQHPPKAPPKHSSVSDGVIEFTNPVRDSDNGIGFMELAQQRIKEATAMRDHVTPEERLRPHRPRWLGGPIEPPGLSAILLIAVIVMVSALSVLVERATELYEERAAAIIRAEACEKAKP